MKINSLSRVVLLSLLLSGTALLETGCREDPRRLQINTELSNLGTDSDRLKRNLSDQESTLEATGQRLTAQTSELSEYRASVQGYMMQHKMAVGALALGLAGTTTVLDKDNAFSEDAKEIGGVGLAIAVIWTLNNMDEVSDVLTTLNQADAHVHSLEASIAQTNSAIARQQRLLSTTRDQLGQLDQKTSTLKQALAQL